MIAKDEEHAIGRAIDSVKSIVQEIIVVDSGSTDNTKEVAKGKGAKVFDFAWGGDFSAARNYALEKATKEWLLVLDCDECVAAEDLPQLKALTTKWVDGYVLPHFIYTNNSALSGWKPCLKPAIKRHSKGYAGFVPVYNVRLFRNGKGYSFKGEVHELVEPSIIEKRGKLEAAAVPIHNYGGADVELLRRKREYYKDIAKRKAAAQDDAQSYYELGIIEKELGQYKEAAASFSNAIKKNQKDYRAFFELGVVLKKLGEVEKAVRSLDKALELKQNDEVLIELGVCYIVLSNLKEAHSCLSRALLLNPFHPAIYTNMGFIFEKSGELEKAEKAYRKSIKLNQANPLPYANLGNVLLKLGSREEAMKHYREAIALGHPKTEHLKNIVNEIGEKLNINATN
jgi:Flp pilus assembly protein TadD